MQASIKIGLRLCLFNIKAKFMKKHIISIYIEFNIFTFIANIFYPYPCICSMLMSMTHTNETPSIFCVIYMFPRSLMIFPQLVIPMCQILLFLQFSQFVFYLRVWINYFKRSRLWINDMFGARWGRASGWERGKGGGWKSHLIANKSQNTLKNCCFSFTFQTYIYTGCWRDTKHGEENNCATQR